jgi:flagellar biosynthesis anti-sigma factor FlgM
MRVDLKNYGTESVESNKPDRARTAPSASEQAAADAPDYTHFSFSAARVRALTSQVLAQPEVRQQRVDLLRQLVGKGEYSISDTQIADAIISDFSSGSASQPTG